MSDLLFLEDIYPDDFLYAVTIRSPVPKGRLKSIQVPKLPDSFTFITSRQIPAENSLEDGIPILADNHLSYVGEPVAILLGNDKSKLEDIASQCVVLVDEEKPVFSFEADAQIAAQREILVGEINDSFENAGDIVKGHYSTGIQDHWYAEPLGAITWYEDRKNNTPDMIIKTATQWPYHVKRSVAGMLGIDPSGISVEPTELNLHMDGKLWYPSLISCHAALCTFLTKKPVRLILTREEDFLYSPKRCRTNITISSVTDKSGKITAAEIEIYINLGAYGVNANEIIDQVCLGSLGFNNLENFKLTAKAFKTNIPPQGPFTGFGLAQGLFAIERHISQIADKMNQDPAQYRKTFNNLNTILFNAQNRNVVSDELMTSAVKMSDYHRKWASYELLRKSRKGRCERGEELRGIGIAAGYQGNDLLYCGADKGSYSVEVTLTKESILEIKTSITSIENYDKIWEKVALETMSIQPEMVRIISSNSPDCGPSCASRNITVITRLVEKCCQEIRKQRFHNPLPITVRRSVKPKNGSLRGFFHPPSGKLMDTSAFLKPGIAFAVVEVSIDPAECWPKIRGVWAAVDGGKIISINRAKRNLVRASTQALGWAFSENIEYINGVLPHEQYLNFSIIPPADIPQIEIDFLYPERGSPKGVGELPFNCIPAAFIQAVSQAMDHSFNSIPIKKNDIWEIVKGSK